MGKLFYIIGASGAGKDSLIDYARQKIPNNTRAIIAHRYITRPSQAGSENHISLTTEEFLYRRENGLFAMSWHAHNTWYGIGIEINQWLAKGLTVLVNGSRGYLAEASLNYPELTPVLVRCDADILRQRLIARGRETMEQIESRLSKAEELNNKTIHPRLMRIENNDSLNIAGDRFLSLIDSTYAQGPSR